jgi:putative holliday junction resolvase
MKYLGIDFGTKRIGIALSDEGGEFAFPKEIIPNTPNALGYIKKLTEEEGIKDVVLGYSVASNDIRNEISGEIERFKNILEKAELTIHYEREGFSSVEAYRYQQTKGPVDDSAAAIILQRFLDKRKKTN